MLLQAIGEIMADVVKQGYVKIKSKNIGVSRTKRACFFD